MGMEQLKFETESQAVVSQAKQTSELFWCGVIQRDNAIDCLWRNFRHARYASHKAKIAGMIGHIEENKWR
jgi:hypothetical protein